MSRKRLADALARRRTTSRRTMASALLRGVLEGSEQLLVLFFIGRRCRRPFGSQPRQRRLDPYMHLAGVLPQRVDLLRCKPL